MENNYRLECNYCKKELLTKSYSNHLLSSHKNEIFNTKRNYKELKEFSDGSSIWWSPIQLLLRDTYTYYIPCCGKFYTKKCTADKHLSGNMECKNKGRANAKELLCSLKTETVKEEEVVSKEVREVYEKVIKVLYDEIDDNRFNKASYIKKNRKYEKYFKEHKLDELSDTSDIESYYSESEINDDGLDKKLYYDIKEVYDNKLLKLLRDNKIDLSRGKLGLSTR